MGREMKQAVERGAAVLDAREPDWWMRIDPATLDMGHCGWCVLGQVLGLGEVNLYKQADRFWNYIDTIAIGASARDYGFSLHPGESWDALGDLWMEQVKARADAGGAVPPTNDSFRQYEIR